MLIGRRSEALTMFVLSTATVSAMVAGALTIAGAMYESGRDPVAVLAVIAAGAALSLLIAWTLGRQVAAAGRRARAREAARRELIAWISEDLRAPLDSLRRTLDGLDSAHPVHSDLDRLAALADDLAEISRS